MVHRGNIQLVGRATKEPYQVSTEGSGKKLHVVVRMALNHGYFDAQGRWQDKNVTFLDVNCWNTLAHNVLKTVEKGMPLIVLGRMETRTWTGKDEQGAEVQRSGLSVYANHIGPDLTHHAATVVKTDWAEEEADVATGSGLGDSESETGGSAAGGRAGNLGGGSTKSSGGGRAREKVGAFADNAQPPF